MTTRTALAYEEVVDFIAAGPKPGKIIAFKPSAITKERVADLIYREKTEGLTPAERSELEHYLQLEHLMRLTKARARRYTANEQLRQ
jgi:O-succinylbenzoate synthase